MKLVRQRSYKTTDRIGFEGLYLNNTMFKYNTPISVSTDSSSSSILISTTKNKSSHKVTQNVTRSGKNVPAICIKNKEVSKFLGKYKDLDIYIFKSIIILASKKHNNRNNIICRAIIAHNKSLRENIKSVINFLISMNVIDDVLFLDNSLELNDTGRINNQSDIPRKVLSKLKKTLRHKVYKATSNEIVSLKSNSYVLSSIIKKDKKPSCDEDEILDLEEVNLLLTIVTPCFKNCNNTLKSIVKNNCLFRNKFCYDDFGWHIALEQLLLKNKILGIIESIILNLFNIIFFYKISIKILLIKMGFLYLDIRKQINTLSPPH